MRHSSKDRERQLRFSIRKFTAGVASVAIASLYFLSASPVSADSHTITVDSVELSSLTAQERQQVTFALPPMIDPNHDACYILVYQPKGSGTNVVAVSPATGSGRTTGGSAKSQLMKALPSTGSKELDVAFYGLGAGMLGLAGYMLWKNKKSGKYLLVAVIAAGGVASSTDVLAAMRFLAPTQNIVIESDNGLYTLTPQEIEGYEYVGYMTKDCELIPADTTDATKYVPVGQGQTVEQGGTLDPVKSISNLVDLPKGTTVAFKTPVDTNTSGDKDAIVVVKYPDGSSEEVAVNVTITPKAPTTPTPTQKEADRYTPTGQSQVVELGQPVEASGSISNLVDLPKGAVVAFETPVDTSTSGIKNAVVIVTYPDGSLDKVPVTIGVTETIKISHSETHNPHGHNQTVTVGSAVDATKSISDFSSLIAGTTATFAVPVDTTTPGVKDAVVVVTYPDGSTDIVSVQVTVNAIPRTEDQTVHVGEAPAPERSVPNLEQLPQGTSVAFKEPVDTTTIGDKEAIIVVTYPDGTTEERPVVVTVIVDPTPVPVIPNVDTFNPFGQPQTVTQGGTVEATGSIANFDDLIPGTTATFVTPVDTTTPGDKPATVLVSYPDGTSESVDVVVTVLEATKPAPLPDTSAPKLNEPAKTPVADKTNLTDDEKAKVAEEVKKVNPELPADAEITVGNDGAVTVKVPGKDEATLTPAQTVVDKPDTSAPKLNEPAKTPVADKTNLTDDEKAKVAEEVKKANPELPADAEITVGNDGAVTVKVPGKDEATLTPAQTVVDKPDTSPPKLNEPAKTPVADKTNLTDAEKAKVEEEVKKANPELPAGTEVAVGNDGKVTITYPDKTTDELTPEVTVEQKPKDTDRITPNNPVKTPVADLTKLTDDEKTKVADEVKKANPDFPAGTEVTVGNDGKVTITYPDKTTDELTPEVTVEEQEQLLVNAPALTPVADKSNLTSDEKAAVQAAIKAANPALNLTDDQIVVGNDGSTTITVPGKKPASLTPAQTVTDQEQLSVTPPALTPVADKSNLTSGEKAAVQAAVKAANPTLNLTDDQIVVNNDGSTTITVPGKKPASLTPAQTVTDQEQLSVTPPALTPVADKSNLTSDEKAAVTAAIKEANPTLNLTDDQIVVNNDGSTTITVPGKKPASLTQAQTVIEKTAAPTVNPIDSDDTAITGTGIPGATVSVTVPGSNEPKTATVTPEGTWSIPVETPLPVGTVIPATQKEDEKAPSSPVDTTVTAAPVTQPTNTPPTVTAPTRVVAWNGEAMAPITVEASDPDANDSIQTAALGGRAVAGVTASVTDGTVTISGTPNTRPGSYPNRTVVVTDQNGGRTTSSPFEIIVLDATATAVTPADQTPPTEQAILDAVTVQGNVALPVTKALKAGTKIPTAEEIRNGASNEVEVDVTVDGKTKTVKVPINYPAPAEPLTLNAPAKTPVDNINTLTADDKTKVRAAIKAANPSLNLTDAQIAVADNGDVTVTVDGKQPATLTQAQTVEQKPQVDPSKFTLSNVSISLASTPNDTSTGRTEGMTITNNSVSWGTAGRTGQPNSSLTFATSGSQEVSGESGVELVIGSVTHHNAGLAGGSNLLREIDVNMTYTITANGQTPEARTFKLGRLFVMEAASGSYDYFILETSTDTVTIGDKTYTVQITDFLPQSTETGSKVDKATIQSALNRAQRDARPTNLQAFLDSSASANALYVATLEKQDIRTGRGSDNPFDIKVTVTVKP